MPLLRTPGDAPLLVGHRGACDVAPENTMPSFERALRDGADIVEADVRLSADGEVMVVHDATVDRTTNGMGLVAAMTRAELQALDAGSWFDASYRGAHIPTLTELATWARGRIGLMLEFKFDPYGSFEPTLVPKTLAVVDAVGVRDQVVTISYQRRALAQLKGAAPDVPAGPLMPRNRRLAWALWWAERFPPLRGVSWIGSALLSPLRYTVDAGCDIVAPNVDLASRLLVQAAHGLGMPVSCGGAAWDYPRAIRLGLDTISANDPGLIFDCFFCET
jgi:glycerophosphoryl diester phosphodiesterase